MVIQPAASYGVFIITYIQYPWFDLSRIKNEHISFSEKVKNAQCKVKNKIVGELIVRSNKWPRGPKEKNDKNDISLQ